jgi:hypothetical protein
LGGSRRRGLRAKAHRTGTGEPELQSSGGRIELISVTPAN